MGLFALGLSSDWADLEDYLIGCYTAKVKGLGYYTDQYEPCCQQ